MKQQQQKSFNLCPLLLKHAAYRLWRKESAGFRVHPEQCVRVSAALLSNNGRRRQHPRSHIANMRCGHIGEFCFNTLTCFHDTEYAAIKKLSKFCTRRLISWVLT